MNIKSIMQSQMNVNSEDQQEIPVFDHEGHIQLHDFAKKVRLRSIEF